MNIRAFIGLSLLIVALLVASVPELLEPTSKGVERGLVMAGAIPDAEKVAKAKAAKAKKSAPDKDELSDKRLELRGFVVEKDGDLRDTIEEDVRAANRRARLEAGTTRTPLPGQLDDSGADVPPASSEDGVLLDITGCPMFRPDTDVAVLLLDEELVKLYEDKVAKSDDPEACEPLLSERIATATAAQSVAPLGATSARERAAIRRGGTAAMIVGLGEIQLLSQIMDDETIQDALDALAAAQGTATAADATAAADGAAAATADKG